MIRRAGFSLAWSWTSSRVMEIGLSWISKGRFPIAESKGIRCVSKPKYLKISTPFSRSGVSSNSPWALLTVPIKEFSIKILTSARACPWESVTCPLHWAHSIPDRASQRGRAKAGNLAVKLLFNTVQIALVITVFNRFAFVVEFFPTS